MIELSESLVVDHGGSARKRLARHTQNHGHIVGFHL
jgi:hypothetical protein